MKKNWIALVSLALNLVLVALVLWQGSRLDTLEQDLWNVQANLLDRQDQVMDEVDALREDVQEGERLIADCALEPAGLDPETRSVLLNASVTLKEWGEDTDAALLLELEGQTTEAPLTHGGNGVFTGEAAVPVEENGSLTVTLLADTGGTVTREQAEFVYQLSDLLPVTDGATGTSTPYWEEDTLLLQSGFSFCPYDRDHDYVEVRDPEFRLYRNGELILEEAAVYHPMSDDIPYCYYLREVNEDGLGQTIPVDAQPGDDLRLAFACQDQFGLAYEFTVDRWQVLDGDVEKVYLDGDRLPTLTWPE